MIEVTIDLKIFNYPGSLLEKNGSISRKRLRGPLQTFLGVYAACARKICWPWDFRRSRYPWLIYTFLSLPVDGLRWTDNECWTVKTLDHQTVCRRKSISVEEGAPGALSLAASIEPSGEERNLIFFPVIMFNCDFIPFPCHLLCVASG